MRFSTAFAIAAASVSFVSAETFNVKVGEGGLTFTPPSITAAEGDIVEFEFFPKNHTVTQSTFATPCEAMTSPAAGIDSGFVPVAADATEHPVWSMTVNNASTPLWFYCRPHCQLGMVFAVNPTAARTFEDFQAAAMGGAASGSASGTAGSTGTAGTGTASGTAGNTAGAGGAGASATGSAAGAGATDGATSVGASSALLVAFVGIATLLL